MNALACSSVNEHRFFRHCCSGRRLSYQDQYVINPGPQGLDTRFLGLLDCSMYGKPEDGFMGVTKTTKDSNNKVQTKFTTEIWWYGYPGVELRK